MRPTESELEILQILWQNDGEMTVRAINDLLNKKREVGYTTTLKTMQLMLEKGLLSRTEAERQHLYQTAIARSETQGVLVSNLVQNAFSGSAARLVMQALGNHTASAEELAEIKKIIQSLENEQVTR
jgi:BlaI family transcriptional regulator, penicillinase repressor